jgi:putative addiction module component (TIGR02574 family)
MNRSLLEQARQLSVDEKLELVEVLWDDIGDRSDIMLPTPSQLEELEQRLADHEANPEDILSWDEVKAPTRARIRR